MGFDMPPDIQATVKSAFKEIQDLNVKKKEMLSRLYMAFGRDRMQTGHVQDWTGNRRDVCKDA
jgi:hypothetical protein